MIPHLVMNFGTSSNRAFTYRLNHADARLSTNSIRSAMNNLVNLNPFDTDKGSLTAPRSAMLVYSDEKELDINI